jgi:hypothetical protein
MAQLNEYAEAQAAVEQLVREGRYDEAAVICAELAEGAFALDAAVRATKKGMN